MFLLVPAYPGCPGQTAVKWLGYSLSQYVVSADDMLFLVSAISTILLSTNNHNINAISRQCNYVIATAVVLMVQVLTCDLTALGVCRVSCVVAMQQLSVG